MEALLSQDELEQELRGINLPPQPQIITDLQLAKAANPPDLNVITDLICRDISISASVIKVANSPFYGLSKPVTSIHHAIMMIGTQGVINIVNSVALRQALMPKTALPEPDNIFLSRFWESAEKTAKIAALVSREIELGKPDELYLLGLFHNAGIPLLIQQYRDYRKVVAACYAQTDGLLTDIEQERYNTNHATIAYYMTLSWKMPGVICDTVGQHHSLQTLLADDCHKGSALLNNLAMLKLAEHLGGLYYALGHQEQDNEWQLLEVTLLDYLDMTGHQLDDIRQLCHKLGKLETNSD